MNQLSCCAKRLIPVMVDSILGKLRVLVTKNVKKSTKETAKKWKESLDQHGSIENIKAPEVHTFF